MTFEIARHVVDVEHIGLVNLIAGKRLAPELVQDAATPESLSAALLPLVRPGPVREEALRELANVRARLAAQDTRPAAEHVADLAAELIDAP